jgi:anaerobic magnesium-protoporphyrin IX monomethyl ester cyclase
LSDLIAIKSGAAATAKSGRKLKTMLLFPPEWVPTAPYLALPSLTAVLREQGHEVVQKDVNIEMYDHFFSDSFLVWVKTRMAMQLHALVEKEKREWLTESESQQKAVLLAKAGIDVFDLIERTQRAKDVVRGEAFYDAEKLEWALNVFR